MTIRKPAKAKNGYVLPDDKLKQREAAFAIYRDLGPMRSMNKAHTEFVKQYPKWAASCASLPAWSKHRRP